MADLTQKFEDGVLVLEEPKTFKDHSHFVALPYHTPEFSLEDAHQIKISAGTNIRDTLKKLANVFSQNSAGKLRGKRQDHTVTDLRNPETLASFMVHCTDPKNLYKNRYRKFFEETVYLILPSPRKKRISQKNGEEEVCFEDSIAKSSVGEHRIIPVLEGTNMLSDQEIVNQPKQQIVAVTSVDIIEHEPSIERDGFNYELRIGVIERPAIQKLEAVVETGVSPLRPSAQYIMPF